MLKQLPEPKYEVSFSEGNHQYRAEGKVIPSVTSVIGILDKPALVAWSAKITAKWILERINLIKKGALSYSVGDEGEVYQSARTEHMRESSKAAKIGTAAHKAVENWVTKGKKPTKRASESTRVAFDSFIRWAENNGLKRGACIGSEVRLLSKKYGYAGTLDLLVYLGGKLYLVDVKTSNNFYEPDMPMQLAAYAHAVEEMYDIKVEGLGVIRLDKESGMPHWKDYTKYRKPCFEMFRHLLKFESAKRKMMSEFRADQRKLRRAFNEGVYNADQDNSEE